MSIRPLIGMVQPLASPGSFSARSSADQLFLGDVIRVKWRKTAFAHFGAHDEYQVPLPSIRPLNVK